MSRPILILLAAAIALCSCGIKRPLIPPKDIPAYEKKRQDKLDKQRLDEQSMLQQNGAS